MQKQSRKRNVRRGPRWILTRSSLALALAPRTLFLALALAIPAALLTGCVTAPTTNT